MDTNIVSESFSAKPLKSSAQSTGALRIFKARTTYLLRAAVALTLLFQLGCGDVIAKNPTGFNTIQPAAQSLPHVVLESSGGLVHAGEKVILNWMSDDADSCIASGGWQGGRATSGSETVGPLSSDTSYSISCSNLAGGVAAAVNIAVDNDDEARIDLQLRADKAAVHVSDQVTLFWDASGAERCDASGDWTGQMMNKGSFTTSPLTQTSTFTLTCSGAMQSVISSTTISVTEQQFQWAAPWKLDV